MSGGRHKNAVSIAVEPRVRKSRGNCYQRMFLDTGSFDFKYSCM